MDESERRRLTLWFMRDLLGSDRSALLKLWGITHATDAEQEHWFRKLISKPHVSQS